MAATEVIKRDDKFGLCDTYNPYTNSMSLANVANQRFRIPLNPTFANSSVVVVSTGLVPSVETVLNGDLIFNVYEENNGTLIRQLTPRIVDIGSGQYPTDKEINWFNVAGMQGDFMVHSDYCGKILEMSGKIETCSITAEDINGINKNIQDNYNDLIDRINNSKTKWQLVNTVVRNDSDGNYHPPSTFERDSMFTLEHRFTGNLELSADFYIYKSGGLITGSAAFGININRQYITEQITVSVPVGDNVTRLTGLKNTATVYHLGVYLQERKPIVGSTLYGNYQNGGVIRIDGKGALAIRGWYIW